MKNKSVPFFFLILVCLAPSCSAPQDVPEDDAGVAHVGESAISLAELELYFSLNLLIDEDEEPQDRSGLNRVKSRLLDSLVDEKTLFAEAERRGLDVSDVEIDAYLNLDAENGRIKLSPLKDWRRILARQRMMVQKLQESVARQLPQVPDADVRAYIDESGGRLAPRKRVRLRALRFEVPEDARRVSDQIRRRRMRFEEAVVTYETGPGQGVPLELEWDNFTDDLRDALVDLNEGEVSRPVDFHGQTFLFLVESWLTDPTRMDEELTQRARAELLREHRRQAEADLLRELREQTPIEIHRDRLPFRYLPES